MVVLNNTSTINAGATADRKESQSQSQLQRKKKVRRRVHGSKSYQGRVLNMAEARKEIVTALKIHRATMKANGQKLLSSSPPQIPPLPYLHHHHPLLPPPPPPPPDHQYHQQQKQQASTTTTDEQESQREMKSRRINRIYAPSSYRIDFPNYHSSSINSDNDPRKQQLLLHDLNSNTATSSSSSSSSSSSFPINTNTRVATLESDKIDQTPVICKTTSLHPVMDDEKMAEIRLLGEQHAMEWNDNLNMATALAWWCKFVGEDDDRNIFNGDCLNDFCRVDDEQVPSFICHDHSNPEICCFPWL